MNQFDNTQEVKNDLNDHPALQVLQPHFQSYARKALTAVKSGDHAFKASAVEIYAQDVFDRVSELDTALSGLRMSLDFIVALDSQEEPAPKVYRYHYENFVLRSIGLVDRAHQLVGYAFLMDKAKVNSIGGNRYVQSKIDSDYSDVRAALKRVEQEVADYRARRNDLIHSSALSTRELSLFMALQHFDMDTGDDDVDELARSYFSQGAQEISSVISGLVETLTSLLLALAPIFSITARLGGSVREKSSIALLPPF